MRRQKPIYLTTIVGKPILEDANIGKVIERSFLPLIRMFHPEVVDFAMPAAGWFQGMAIISIKKRYPGQAKKVMMGLWGTGQLALTKMFVVVDDDINVHDINLPSQREDLLLILEVAKTLLRDLVVTKAVKENPKLIHSDLSQEIQDTAMHWSLSALLKRLEVLHRTTLAIRANANTKLALEAMMLSWAEG